jgi:hypothetical protein
MEFPFKLNTSDEVAVTLNGKEMRFVANYPHAFHSPEDLDKCAAQARDGRYDGLSLLPDSPSVCFGLLSTMDTEEFNDYELHRFHDDGGPIASDTAKTKVLVPRKAPGFFQRLRDKLIG